MKKEQSEEAKLSRSENMKRLWADPEFVKKRNDALKTKEYKDKVAAKSKEMWQDPAYKEKHAKAMEDSKTPESTVRKSAASKKMWEDPAYAEKMRASRQSPAYRELQAKNQTGKTHNEQTRDKLSKISKEMWEDPAFKEKHAKAMEEVVNTPEFKEKQSKASKTRWEDPEYKQRLIDIHKISCNDPEYLKKRSEISKRIWEDPEYRKLQSKIQTELNNDPKRKEYFTKLMKELWEDPVYYQRLCDAKKGENNPLWNNGSSDRGYCYKFIEVQPRVRAYFNDTCVDCGKTKAEEGREMSVHHVYSNKNVCCDEDERKVLVTVCASCHGKIPKYRLKMTPEHLKKIKLWEEKYLNLIANKYGGKCYYTVEEMEMIFETLENEQI